MTLKTKSILDPAVDYRTILILVALTVLIWQTFKVSSSYFIKFVLKSLAFSSSKTLFDFVASVLIVNKNFKVVFLSLLDSYLNVSSLTLHFRLASG